MKKLKRKKQKPETRMVYYCRKSRVNILVKHITGAYVDENGFLCFLGDCAKDHIK